MSKVAGWLLWNAVFLAGLLLFSGLGYGALRFVQWLALPSPWDVFASYSAAFVAVGCTIYIIISSLESVSRK